MSQASAEKAYFGAGCFWGVEHIFQNLTGVNTVVSGYAGGSVDNPSYQQVSVGTTGHTEAVQIYFDPQKVTYEKLLDVFWKNIDPLDSKGQFCDKGSQYRSGIFFQNEEQKKLAEKSKEETMISPSSQEFKAIKLKRSSIFFITAIHDFGQK